jgi:hypothetical protein
MELTNLLLDATDDLISLADSTEGSSNPKSPTSFGSVSRKIPEHHRTVHRDSFSDLAVLMKAKKPYTPIPPPTPRPSLSLASNGEYGVMMMYDSMLNVSRYTIRKSERGR